MEEQRSPSLWIGLAQAVLPLTVDERTSLSELVSNDPCFDWRDEVPSFLHPFEARVYFTDKVKPPASPASLKGVAHNITPKLLLATFIACPLNGWLLPLS
jgi:hypothetical protein